MGEETRAGLLTRLDWMTIAPKMILDVGAGLGELTQTLQHKYPEAEVWAVDTSVAMLEKAKEKHIRTKANDAATLTFPDNSVDLLIANLLLPWQSDFAALFKEWRRVLHQDGLLMFTTFGPDTLKECRAVFNNEDIPLFADMHDFGDLLLQAGFTDPVLDVDYLTVNYKEQNKLLAELKATGMWFPRDTTEITLSTLQMTYELVYAHAFVAPKTDTVAASQDGVVRIPLDHLRRQLK